MFFDIFRAHYQPTILGVSVEDLKPVTSCLTIAYLRMPSNAHTHTYTQDSADKVKLWTIRNVLWTPTEAENKDRFLVITN